MILFKITELETFHKLFSFTLEFKTSDKNAFHFHLLERIKNIPFIFEIIRKSISYALKFSQDEIDFEIQFNKPFAVISCNKTTSDYYALLQFNKPQLKVVI